MKIMLNWLKSHNYVFLALYLPIYLILYFVLEGAVTTGYWVSWCPLDELIPFCSPFVVFYVLWFPLIFLTGLYVLIFDPETFRRYMWFLAAGFSTSLLVCALFPNGQDMRPALEGANAFERLVMSLYGNDTNTNVIPSMHVVAAINVVFAFFFSDRLRKPWLRIFAVVMCVLISASTVLIKQHSILDFFAAVILCAALWPLVYRKRKGQRPVSSAPSQEEAVEEFVSQPVEAGEAEDLEEGSSSEADEPCPPEQGKPCEVCEEATEEEDS